MRSHSSLRAPPPETRADVRPRRRARAAARASRGARRRRPPAPNGPGRRGRVPGTVPTNAARTSGSAWGVRSPARYGAKRTPSDAGRVLSGFRVERPVVDADEVAEPAERAGGREHHAHRVPGPGHRVAEDVRARQRIGRERVERGEDDAGRAEHDGERAGLDDADAERGRRLVSRAGDLGRLVRARKPLARELERGAHLVAPASLRDVEEQRPGSVRDVGRVLAAEAQPHVVLRQQDVRDPRVRLRLVPPKPEQLRRGEARSARGCPSGRRGARARCVPRSRRTRRPCAGRSRGSPAAAPARSASSTTSPCICPERPIAAGSTPSAASARCAACHQSSGSCSDQPGCGIESG